MLHSHTHTSYVLIHSHCTHVAHTHISHALAHVCIHCTHACTYACTHMACTHAHMVVHAHAHTHVHTHACTYAHTHAHTHAHTYPLIIPSGSPCPPISETSPVKRPRPAPSTETPRHFFIRLLLCSPGSLWEVDGGRGRGGGECLWERCSEYFDLCCKMLRQLRGWLHTLTPSLSHTLTPSHPVILTSSLSHLLTLLYPYLPSLSYC